MVALSCVIGLSLALGVTWWQVSQLTAGVRSPLWTDSPGKAHPLWWAFVFAGGLLAIQVTGRVMHEALPMLFGYVAGCDLAILVVMVILASRGAGPRAV